MFQQIKISLPGYRRGFHLITNVVEKQLPPLPKTGLINLFIQHTSAALTINENADPSVRTDFNSFFNRLVPDGDKIFIHCLEGDDDMPAHIKTSLLGVSVNIPIVNGRLGLGTWQGIYLCEFRDYSAGRDIVVTIME